VVLKRIRSSLALKLILASAIPSAVVLLTGLGALVAHSRLIAATNPALAFEELRDGAVVGTLLSLTFAGMAVALAVRHFLVKPIQALSQVMARAELGEFLVRARVQSEDELGKLARSFNTMLARVTDMAVERIETRQSLEQMEREINVYGISSWKWYCHTDPAQTGNGFQMDDDNAQWFIEESRKRGMKLISVHKGYSYQSRTLAFGQPQRRRHSRPRDRPGVRRTVLRHRAGELGVDPAGDQDQGARRRAAAAA